MAERLHESKIWKNAAGEGFRVLIWPSQAGPAHAGSPKTLLFIHHGHGEHAGRYQSIARALRDAPIEIRAFDARGHGESVGPRGVARDVDHLVDDLEEVLRAQREDSGAEHVVLFGHSMGGGVVARYLTTRAAPPWLAAGVLSAPFLRAFKSPVQSVKLAVGRALAKVAPAFTMGTGVDPSFISTVPEEVRKYKADALVHDKVCASLGVSWIDTGEACIEDAPRVTLPMLLYHGAADTQIDPGGTRAFYERLSSKEKAFHLLEGVRHEPHHAEPVESAKVFQLLKDFLARSEAKAA